MLTHILQQIMGDKLIFDDMILYLFSLHECLSLHNEYKNFE